jgi:hypothetical protein
VPGSAPYSMPYLGGAYGGYIGMTGNWAYWLGCAGQWSGGGGVTNGIGGFNGDLDTIDSTRLP